ncbi:MAG TPA: glutamate 5-kinase, partial [Acidimicrobiales bacterium]|nr:glutamate 5-kinase [Acidimicrobiales bacterium]
MLVVVKIGSSSVTTPRGEVNETAIAKLCSEVAEQMGNGVQVVVVTSGAIAAGIDAAGIDFGSAGRSEENRPTDLPTLQAIASVGQPKLMRVYGQWLARYGLVLGQVLLTPLDFQDRRQYLHARRTVARLLALGVVPIVNENDVTADDEIRFGDNDRLAALVAHMVGADLLVILTDTAGVFTADPRIGENASLIEEVTEIDHQLEQAAGGAGSAVGSGGMVSKLAAAKIACWSGIRVVIADAKKTGVLAGAVAGESGVGTIIYPKDRRLSSRKLWLAFAVAPAGSVT